MYDLIVIGAGVSGLMAAAEAASRGLNVVLLEKMERPARKLRITGKGRCNLTNTKPLPEFSEKIKSGREFLQTALEQFSSQNTVSLFENLGVELVVERGDRVFPASGKAWDVANALVNRALKNNVKIHCDCEVVSIENHETPEKKFEVNTSKGDFAARNILITTGGVSYPATGSTGDGYQFAYDFGHQIVELRPALVPLEIASIGLYKGLALKNIGVKLSVDGAIVEERFGDVEFTDKGISGATIIQISRTAVDAIIDKRSVQVDLDLKSALSPLKLTNRISREIDQLPGATVRVLLQKLTPSPLHLKICEQAQIDLRTPLDRLSDKAIGSLVEALKSLNFKILDYRPFTEAIITAGGVDCSEINDNTMESLKVNGLYFAGEVLDIDADTGGYNIQLALSTAYLAAHSIK